MLTVLWCVGASLRLQEFRNHRHGSAEASPTALLTFDKERNHYQSLEAVGYTQARGQSQGPNSAVANHDGSVKWQTKKKKNKKSKNSVHS